MAKKRRHDGREKPRTPSAEVPAAAAAPAADAAEGEKRRIAPWLWISAVILVLLGYYSLTKADPGGRNLWSSLSPALLLAGYLLFIPAIVVSYPSKG